MEPNEIFWKVTERERGEFFERMTKEEAEAFFRQYLRLGDERIAQLNRQFYQTGGGNESELDFDPESLLPLWRWAAKRLKRREFTSAEIEHIESLPDWFRQDQMSKKPLSEETVILLNDIAYYFAEVLVRTLQGVHWDVCRAKVKRYIHQNQPVVVGFSAGFELGINPRDSVKGIARLTLDGKAGDDALVQFYEDCYNKVSPR
jgi:hypothetical protein